MLGQSGTIKSLYRKTSGLNNTVNVKYRIYFQRNPAFTFGLTHLDTRKDRDVRLVGTAHNKDQERIQLKTLNLEVIPSLNKYHILAWHSSYNLRLVMKCYVDFMFELKIGCELFLYCFLIIK